MVMKRTPECLTDVVTFLAFLDIVSENLRIEAVRERVLILGVIAVIEILGGVQLAPEHIVRHPHSREHQA